MKNTVQKVIVVIWLLVLSTSVKADVLSQNSPNKDCSDNCFRSEILSIEESEDGCFTYQLKVYTEGSCTHALSHYTVEVPTCFSISAVENSEGWKQEVGNTDPKTGLYGFKIDEIQEFGETQGEEFTITFTVCGSQSCETELSCWSPQVAYKAGTCVFYEQTEINCVNLSASLEKTDVSCNGANDGSIQVVIDEGNGPFTFDWSNEQSTQTIEGLSAGSYSVVITDGDGNTLDLDTTVLEPGAISVTSSITNADCSGIDNGSIDLTVSGGSGNYTYQWASGQQTEDLSNLSGGMYFATITDDSGCSITERFTIGYNTTLSIQGTVSRTSCSEEDGAIDVTVSGGEAPYTYSWDNNKASEDLNNLPAGLYRLTVTDASGCSANGTFVVQENNPIQLNASVTQTSCVEDNSGAVDLTVTGGAAPYAYEWDNGETTEDINSLASGAYNVTVSDQNGCSASLRVFVTNESFTINQTVEKTSCSGNADGSITLSVSNGMEPYTYSWDNGESSSSISNLTAGLYRVTVSDASGCEQTAMYVVGEPAPITASGNVTNTDCTVEGYSVSLTVSGGTPGYTYNWSNGSSESILIGIAEGEYTVEVTDANGCTTSETILVSAADAGCDTGDNGDGTDGDGTDGDGTDGDGTDGDGTDGDGTDGDGTDGDGTDGDGTDGDGTDGDGTDGDGTDGDGPDEPNPGTGDCEEPFYSEITLVEKEGNCYTYRVIVNYDGNKSYGLSHMSIGVGCGSLGDISNSEGWAVETGTDPTTGVSGFKIDNISGFGEGNFNDSFEANFTVCSTDDDCELALQEADFEVAYKYGQCISYQDVEGDMGLESDLNAYPNPFNDQTTIEFTSPVDTYAKVELFNKRGVKVKVVYEGTIEGGALNQFKIDAYNLPSDLYTYKIATGYNIYHGKLMKY